MFAHIYFLYHPEINKGGIFGYEYWSVFFASLMYPVLFFDFAFLWQRVAKRYITDKKGLKYSNILIATFYFFSLFYLAITVFPYNNSYARIGLNPFWYYIVAGLGTLFMVTALVYIPKRYQDKTIQNLTEKLGKYTRACQIFMRFATRQKNNSTDQEVFLKDYKSLCVDVDNATD